jgi:hypothetical protein
MYFVTTVWFSAHIGDSSGLRAALAPAVSDESCTAIDVRTQSLFCFSVSPKKYHTLLTDRSVRTFGFVQAEEEIEPVVDVKSPVLQLVQGLLCGDAVLWYVFSGHTSHASFSIGRSAPAAGW